MEPEPLFEGEDIRDEPGGYDLEIDLGDENAPSGQPTSTGTVFGLVHESPATKNLPDSRSSWFSSIMPFESSK